MESSEYCMPTGGPLAFDTYMIYTFINLVGYGESSGFLKTWLREEDQNMIQVDFS